MKKALLFTTLLLSVISLLWAQVPQSFKYQAVLRDNQGVEITNEQVSVRINLLAGSETGETIYSEEHTLTTSAQGLINLNIGDGAVIFGDFALIEWTTNKMFVEIAINRKQQGYEVMGTSQLLAVPYALHAQTAANVNDADADPTNEIQDLKLVGTQLSLSNSISTITLPNTSPWQINEGNVVLPEGANVGIGTIKPQGKLEVRGNIKDTPDDILFSVLNNSGDTVFAVYQGGVRINVDDNPAAKTARGGFAVASRGAAKAEAVDILNVTGDSVRVYLNETTAKTARGGFAVASRGAAKGSDNDIFKVSTESNVDVSIDASKLLFYPTKDAFLAGTLFIPSPDSVGQNSANIGYHNMAKGKYSQALGYQSFARGDFSLAVGKNAEANGASSVAMGENATTGSTAEKSYAIGSDAYAKGKGSYAFGNGAIASGIGSFAFGAGGRDSSGVALDITTEATGNNAFALGLGTKATGVNSFSIGAGTMASGENAIAVGFGNTASGRYAIALGFANIASGALSTTWGGGRYNTVIKANVASGEGSTAFGFSTTASGRYSTSFGEFSQATGTYATAWGRYTKATGYLSTAFGSSNTANYNYSTAWGFSSDANAYQTTAAGTDINATSFNAFVVGRANDTIYNHTTINYYDNKTPFSYIDWYNDDPLFVVGNGQYHPAVGTKNALTVLKSGTTIVGWNTSVANSASTPRARFDLSVQTPYDNGYLFYVHGKAGGTTAWTSTSDARLKKNVKTIDGALNKVLNLRGVTYEWKDSTQAGQQIGFIAQETLPILPEVVTGSEKTQFSMQYAPITAVLVEAVKEQNKIIESQKSEIENQKSKVENVISEMDKLKKELEALKLLLNNLSK